MQTIKNLLSKLEVLLPESKNPHEYLSERFTLQEIENPSMSLALDLSKQEKWDQAASIFYTISTTSQNPQDVLVSFFEYIQMLINLGFY